MSLRSRGRDLGAEAAHSGGTVRVTRDGETLVFDAVALPDGSWLLSRDGRRHLVHVARGREGTWVHAGGRAVLIERAARRLESAAATGTVLAPMTGTVVRVLAKPGDAVEADQPLLVLEAMKMQVEIRAPLAGRLAKLEAAAGDSVEGGALLAVVEPAA